MINPALPEPTRHALALIRAASLNDTDGWEALSSVDADELVDMLLAATKVGTVLVGMLCTQVPRQGDALDPRTVDDLLQVVSDAFRHDAAPGRTPA